LIGVSLATRPTSEAKLAATTVSNWGSLVASDESGAGDYRVWLAVLLAVTAGLWFCMR
jgi:hypothetical protein